MTTLSLLLTAIVIGFFPTLVVVVIRGEEEDSNEVGDTVDLNDR